MRCSRRHGTGFVDAIGLYAPRVLTALVLSLVGLALAAVLAAIIRRAMSREPVRGLLDKLGLARLLTTLGHDGSPAELLGQLTRWIVLLVFARSVIHTLGLQTISDAIGALLSFVPEVVAAIVLLVVGIFLSRFVAKLVERASGESDLPFATMLPRLAAVVVLAVAAMMALGQLQIETTILERAATGITWGMALGVALTFGLGARTVAQNLLSGFYLRRAYPPGTSIKVEGVSGELVEVTPLQTVVRSKNKSLSFPNDYILHKVIES